MEPPLEIVDVSLAEPSDGLIGRGLEARLDREPTYALNVGGWILTDQGPAPRVRFVHDGETLWEVPVELERPDVAKAHPGVAAAERSGFYATLSSLALPTEFELRVVSGEIELGRISGRRKPLPPGAAQPIRPVMLTGFSRTGSNLVLRVLGSHQEIVAYCPYRYEPRVLTYWADVFRELTEPAAYLRQIVTAGRIAERGWWLGLAPPMPRPLFDPAVQRPLALDTVEDAADFCRRRIARVYERIAAATARPDARLFAEKLLPGAVPTIAWELFPDAREVFLVRDFRDMIASVLTWKARFGGSWFGHAAARTDEEFVQSFERFAEGLVASWRRRLQQAHLLRYEDLIAAPERTIRALVGYLGVEPSAAALGKMVAGAGERSERSERYRTTESPEASIGRWRRDLTPELAATAEDVFGTALAEFGYER